MTARTALLSAADHRTARRRRGQPPAGGASRAAGAARRRQRGRCGGRDRAGARRRRADDVGARRRRLLPRLRAGERAAPSCSTAPAPRRAPRPRSAMPAAFRAPGRCRSRCRAWSPGSARCTAASAGCPGATCSPRRSAYARDGFGATRALPPFRRRIPRNARSPTRAAPRSFSRDGDGAAGRRSDRAARPRPHA